ncbi:unnamed protein product [Phaedon cochleariae]|uniref:Cap-specific mRNA (nucleoside-2'-O-)-methyltransferase 2 n=1 Tax=Phaedon cochleariae TaxID=80249 RepID=A0A9P0DMX5_PHACE|nr:unnamed protein product [Phaedon cochleariae]
MSEYEDDFKKMYVFKITGQCVLPNSTFESPKWTIAELQNRKKELNKVKGLLSKYKLKIWTKHTANRDRAGFVIKKLSENIQPELLTQAWCKFYEILGQFPIVPLCAVDQKKLQSLHLCEAPGAFVCALNHYLKVNFPGLDWEWMANTLNPNYEGNELSQMIPDDRFISCTLKHWHFGADFSGDITQFCNHKQILEYYKRNGKKVSLITADGSVDCMKDPGEQERHVEHLHFCETMTALAILQKGGAFVLKIFTIFEESTINLLFLLNCVFEKVTIFKPCSSKSGNSEVYVINTKYKGFSSLEKLWVKLSNVYKDKTLYDTKSMFHSSIIPTDFFTEISHCTDFFMEKQTQTILDNIYHFEHKSFDNVYITKSFIAQIYMTKYDLKPIPKEQKIVPIINITDNWRVHRTVKIRGFMKVSMEDLKQMCSKSTDILQIEIGKQITEVKNSKFTHRDNLTKIPHMFKNIKKSTQLYSKLLNLLNKMNVVINVDDFSLQLFHRFQRALFQEIFQNISQEKNFIFINIPFISHFLVGLLYILVFAYESVHFGSGIIILSKPIPHQIANVKNILSELDLNFYNLDQLNKESNFNKDIIQIVSPNLLDTSCLIETIWNYNNQLFCQNQCFVRTVHSFDIKRLKT